MTFIVVRSIIVSLNRHALFSLCRGNRTFNELGSKKKEELLREFRNGVTTRSGLSVRKSQYLDENEQAYDQPQVRQGFNWIKMLGAFFLTNLIVVSAYYLVSYRVIFEFSNSLATDLTTQRKWSGPQ